MKTPMVPPNNLGPDLSGKSVNETQYRGFDLKGYSDSDYVGCNMDKKSTLATARCCANILWMKSQLTDYDIIYERVPIVCDNTSAIAISNNLFLHSRTKHIDIKYHFIRDHVLKEDIELHFIPTQYQRDDIFTKPLDEPSFKILIVELGGIRGDIEHMIPEYENEELTINLTQVFSVHNLTLKPNLPEEPLFTDHMKAICNLDVHVDSKAQKPSLKTKEIPQGKKYRAKSGFKRKQSLKHTSESTTEASKSQNGQSKKETKSSRVKDKSPSHLSPLTPVVGEMHKEAQQAAGGPTSLGATRSNPSVLVDKTKSARYGLKTVHTDSGANKESRADDISLKLKLEDLLDILKDIRSSFFTLDSPPDEPITVLDESEEGEEVVKDKDTSGRVPILIEEVPHSISFKLASWFTLTVPEDDALELNSLVTKFLNDSLTDVVVVFSDPSTLVSGGDVCDGEVMEVTEGASSVTVVVEDSVRLLGSNMKEVSANPNLSTLEVHVLETENIQLKEELTTVMIKHDSLRDENLSIKKRYQDLSMTKASNSNVSSGAVVPEKPKVLAPSLYAMTPKYVPHQRRNNRDVNAALPKKETVVQIILWCLDSGCSRHMTGDRSKLINFVEKFIVGQFCDAGLEVAFRKHTCYIRNEDKVDLLKEKQLSELFQPLFDEDEEFPSDVQPQMVNVVALCALESAPDSPFTTMVTEDAPSATTITSPLQTSPPDTTHGLSNIVKIAKLKENFNGMSIEIRKKEKLLQEEQWAFLSTHPSKRLHSFCFDDDDDEDYTSAITPDEPVLSTEEPGNSLSMGDEHLDTIPATESDEFIKSGVENLIPIPTLNANPTPSFDCKTKSSSNSLNSLLEETNTFDNSLPEFKTFCVDVKEISSGSTTTHPDISLPEYEVFYDDHV
nr:retrovirus-related Pol polyprotein from transposon TNT 1-94 [Tanacetum cinerariifolium]